MTLSALKSESLESVRIRDRKLNSRSQILKRQRVSSDHVAQCVNKQIGTAPAVKPELYFLKVGFKMLRRDTMAGGPWPWAKELGAPGPALGTWDQDRLTPLPPSSDKPPPSSSRPPSSSAAGPPFASTASASPTQSLVPQSCSGRARWHTPAGKTSPAPPSPAAAARSCHSTPPAPSERPPKDTPANPWPSPPPKAPAPCAPRAAIAPP